MNHRPVFLIDQNSVRIAALDVQFRDDHFEGTISLEATPPYLRRLFQEFEEIVEGQMFSLLDNVEEKIAAARLRVVLEDASEACITDLQVFPSRKAVSFKARQPVAAR